MYKHGFFARILTVFIILTALILVAINLGNYSAEKLIQEKGTILEIQLSFKDKTENQLQNKTFILVMQHDNKYYVMEKNQTAIKTPIIYIIPIDQTEYASISTVEK